MKNEPTIYESDPTDFAIADMKLIALCEDGSIFWFDPHDGTFELIQELDGGRYLRVEKLSYDTAPLTEEEEKLLAEDA